MKRRERWLWAAPVLVLVLFGAGIEVKKWRQENVLRLKAQDYQKRHALWECWVRETTKVQEDWARKDEHERAALLLRRKAFAAGTPQARQLDKEIAERSAAIRGWKAAHSGPEFRQMPKDWTGFDVTWP